MKLVSTKVKRIPESETIYAVAIAMDSDIFYAALIDIKTGKNYVEEVSLSPTKEKFTGVFREIKNTDQWKLVSAFFNAHSVFDKFWKGKNWTWNRKDGIPTIPNWFKQRNMPDK